MGRRRKYASLEEVYARRNETRRKQCPGRRIESTDQASSSSCTVALSAFHVQCQAAEMNNSSLGESSKAFGIPHTGSTPMEVPSMNELYALDMQWQKPEQVSALAGDFDLPVSVSSTAAAKGSGLSPFLADVHPHSGCNYCTSAIGSVDQHCSYLLPTPATGTYTPPTKKPTQQSNATFPVSDGHGSSLSTSEPGRSLLNSRVFQPSLDPIQRATDARVFSLDSATNRDKSTVGQEQVGHSAETVPSTSERPEHNCNIGVANTHSPLGPSSVQTMSGSYFGHMPNNVGSSALCTTSVPLHNEIPNCN